MHIPQDQPELSTEGTPGFATIHRQQGSLANPAPGPSARHIAQGGAKTISEVILQATMTKLATALDVCVADHFDAERQR